jgi:uncharacterized protein
MANDLINVEVAYARPEAQALIALTLPAGSTVSQAIAVSGILQQFPAIDLDHTSVGIFSQPCPLDRVLQEADRVEIYRPLLHDPKEARRTRALKK